MDSKWHIKDVNLDSAADLAADIGINHIVARILVGRGIDSVQAAREFISPALSNMPDPFLLKGMEAAVNRLCKAVNGSERVCVYGDYDVDGITGTALLVSFLKRTGFECSYFIPNRFDDGYGLNSEALKRIIDDGVTLVISVDCGITSVAEAEFCRQSGADLIITDHHALKETVPDACAVVNPQQPDCGYPFKALAGVGVAFNLMIALRSRLRESGYFGDRAEPDLREWLDLVALGTIADVVPLVGQNRIYASYGLKLLGNSSRAGIEALKRVAGVKDNVSSGQVGFRLAPRLNAVGRMECAVPGVELLLGSDPQKSALIAEELDAANAERQAVERAILDEAIGLVESSGTYPARRSIVLASPNWHQGVVGIVASRLVERYHRPTILIALDEDGNGKGSGRSIPGFHLLNALMNCSDFLLRFGGHQYAAGVGLKVENLDRFTECFEAFACKMLANVDLVPVLNIDASVSSADVSYSLITELKRLEPFGAGNPEPNFMMRGVRVLERRVVGEKHLKLKIDCGGTAFSGIAFGQSDCSTDGMLDIAFVPELNVWNNSTTIQLRIKNMRQMEV